jgi:hypothetical protein
MFKRVAQHHVDVLKNLDLLTRGKITPYDGILLNRDPRYQELNKLFFESLTTFQNVVQEMIAGQYKWEKHNTIGSWKYILKKVFETLNELPDQPILDLVTVRNENFQNKDLSDYLTPLNMKVLIQSMEEIIESKESSNAYLISQIFESFFKYVFQNDVKYLAIIDSRHIQLTDPISRVNIRRINRNFLKNSKYFTDSFSLKKFVLLLLETLFETSITKTIVINERFKLNILLLIKKMFELGLWDFQDTPKMLDSIHSKLSVVKEFSKKKKLAAGEARDQSLDSEWDCYQGLFNSALCCILNHSITLENDEVFFSAIYPCQLNPVVRHIDELSGDVLLEKKARSAEGHIERSINGLYLNNKEKFSRFGYFLFDGI